MKTEKFKYSMGIYWSDKDDCYIAKIPEFPGLSAYGETQEEAIKEAKIAASGFIEMYKEDGDSIPEPITYDVFYKWLKEKKIKT